VAHIAIETGSTRSCTAESLPTATDRNVPRDPGKTIAPRNDIPAGYRPADGVQMRDTKNRNGAVPVLGATAWRTLMADLKR
jgi:hypothetical protein